jgi:hypothetical protein
MSEATIEAFESESWDSMGEAASEGEGAGETLYEGETAGENAYDSSGEDVRSYPRSRARRIRDARQAQRGRPLPPTPARRGVVSAPIRRPTITAVRSVDLDTRAELDSMRRALARARRNGDMAMYSAVLSALASQGIDTFGNHLGNHDVVKAVFRTAPLALLWPQKPRRGIEGILVHPAFVGAAGIAAIVISGKFVNASHGVDTISVDGPDEISIGRGAEQLSAVASDRKGNTVAIEFTWKPVDSNIAQVDRNGVVTGVTAGKGTYIEASGGGAAGRKFVRIIA